MSPDIKDLEAELAALKEQEAGLRDEVVALQAELAEAEAELISKVAKHRLLSRPVMIVDSLHDYRAHVRARMRPIEERDASMEGVLFAAVLGDVRSALLPPTDDSDSVKDD